MNNLQLKLDSLALICAAIDYGSADFDNFLLSTDYNPPFGEKLIGRESPHDLVGSRTSEKLFKQRTYLFSIMKID